MRVLYLNPFSQMVSGPDESLLTLLRPLIPMGIEAHLVIPAPGPQVPRYEALGVKVHYAPLTILRRRPGVGAAFLPFRLARGVATVARLARREGIDLIHTNMEVVLDGSMATRLLRIPHVLHYRGNTLDRPTLVFDALVRFWTGTADRVLCISEATASIFRTRGRAERVQVVYNPVDLDGFSTGTRSAVTRRALGASADELLVGAVGRLHPRKDLATFLRAGVLLVSEFPTLRLVIVGDAEAREEHAYARSLRGLAAELGLESRVTWAGTRSDMPEVLSCLDALLVSSRHEGFGRVVAEGMAAGVPMVLSREGAFPEMSAQGRAALLAKPGDANEFARHVATLLRGGAARDGLVAAARERAGTFSAHIIARRVAAVYASLLPDRC